MAFADFRSVQGSEAGARNGQERVECGPERPIRAAGEVRRRSQEPARVRGDWRKQARKNPNRERLGFSYWWRRRELNPRPSVLCLWLYMFSTVDCLTSYRPTGRVYSASPVIFGETAPDRHFHDPVLYDNCDHWFTGIPVAIVSGP